LEVLPGRVASWKLHHIVYEVPVLLFGCGSHVPIDIVCDQGHSFLLVACIVLLNDQHCVGDPVEEVTSVLVRSSLLS
jgi:hypothetical protein